MEKRGDPNDPSNYGDDSESVDFVGGGVLVEEDWLEMEDGDEEIPPEPPKWISMRRTFAVKIGTSWYELSPSERTGTKLISTSFSS